MLKTVRREREVEQGIKKRESRSIDKCVPKTYSAAVLNTCLTDT